MGNKRINKAYVRYDGTGRVIPGSLILNRFKPKVGNWQETPAYLCCNEAPILALRLLFSNISEVDAIVGDSSNVADWNTYFDLPTYGSPFTSVEVVGDEVRLFGGSNIIIKQSLFDQADELGTFLISVNDGAGSVIEIEYDGFGTDYNSGCPNLVSVNFPNLIVLGEATFTGYNGTSLISVSMPQLTTTDDDCFWDCNLLTNISFPSLTTIGYSLFVNCTSLTSISLPACTNLGPTVGDNNVFTNITGNVITLTIPSALMICNSGNPDGDIQELQANNTVTVVTV